MVLAAQSGLLTTRGIAAPLDIPDGLPAPTALVATPVIQAKPDAATKTRISEAYGKLPLSFEINQGQTDDQVKYLARGPGYTVFLTPTEAVLALRTEAPGLRTEPSELRTEQRAMRDERTAAKKEEHRADNGRRAVVRMKLVGANAEAKLGGLDELPGKSNYFIGNDPKKWRTNIPHYGKVRYREAYPGIDLVFYGNPRQLEYDFVIAPGADPNDIMLAFEGVDRLEIDNEGNLILHLPGDHLIQRAPIIYQETNGSRQSVTGHYVLRDKDRIGVHVAAYDPSKPLVIDPVLVYSTFLGGSAGDVGNGIAVDFAGNAYVTGSTLSADFPTTAGAFDTGFAGGGVPDAFVTKLNTTGTALVYSTYLGGGNADVGNGIAVDGACHASVTGSTASAAPTAFPTTPGAFQTSLATAAAVTDTFVTKLNTTGTALVYSTYLGGSAADVGNGIALDGVGNAYVTGETSSANFPTAGSPFQAALSIAPDAFVTKLNSSGTALVYSTYLGGSAGDIGRGIAVDSLDNAYVTGETGPAGVPTPFPTTAGAFDTTFNGVIDAFIAKLMESPAAGGGGGGGGGGGCFIAVAAFGSPMAPQVQLLREFRDRYLTTNPPGRLFVSAYYRISPPVASRIADSEVLRAITRAGLIPVIGWVSLFMWSPILGLAIPVTCLGIGTRMAFRVITRYRGRS